MTRGASAAAPPPVAPFTDRHHDRPITAASNYRPLRDYAIIGDGRTAALVARDGSIDWWCLPRFDSPAVFCRLLDDRRGGFFSIAPSTAFETTRGYVGRTNVLATTFTTSGGRARVTDYMPWPPPRWATGGSVIVRQIDGLTGRVDYRADLRATFDYARADAAIEFEGGLAIVRGPDCVLTLASPSRIERTRDDTLSASFSVGAGERCWLLLSSCTQATRPTDGDLDDALASTLSAWERWSAHCEFAGNDHARVERSALLLKLLIYEPTGALIAAPTTSLPEQIGGVRNWDYRYTWLRDAAWILDVLMRLGQHSEARAFWGWLEGLCLACCRELQIMYRVDGDEYLTETLLTHLEGYRGSSPVRIGNAAASQLQLDVYGDVLDALYICSSHGHAMRPLSPILWRVVRLLADEAALRWRAPDQGLWEARSPPRHYVSSKLGCWLALDRAIKLAERDGAVAPLATWREARAQIRTAIEEQGYDSRLGAFTQSFGASDLDASALLISRIEFLPAHDPRMRSTVARIREHLMRGGLVARYASDDGVAGGENAFALCSFWLAEALAREGKHDEARAVFDRVVGCANDVGLLSEEINPTTGELLGNFPQGYTHLGLIRAALEIRDHAHREPVTAIGTPR